MHALGHSVSQAPTSRSLRTYRRGCAIRPNVALGMLSQQVRSHGRRLGDSIHRTGTDSRCPRREGAPLVEGTDGFLQLDNSNPTQLNRSIWPGARAGWYALVQWGLLSGEECGEVVEGGGPSGLGVVAAGGVGSVAERHPRFGAVVVELHAGDRGLVHSHLWHWVGA
jgi:hypothetical protein